MLAKRSSSAALSRRSTARRRATPSRRPPSSSRPWCTSFHSSSSRSSSSPAHLRFPYALEMLGKVFRTEYVALHPLAEALAVAAYLVPCLIEGIVAGVIAVGVGGVGPPGHYRDS